MLTESEVYKSLNEIFRELFDDDSISLTARTVAEDVPGWDSFNHLNIIAAVQERFQIRTNTREVEDLANVGDIVRLIIEKTGQSKAKAD
jgi:acyl carrier protein